MTQESDVSANAGVRGVGVRRVVPETLASKRLQIPHNSSSKSCLGLSMLRGIIFVSVLKALFASSLKISVKP
jgi:hypothetical protein